MYCCIVSTLLLVSTYCVLFLEIRLIEIIIMAFWRHAATSSARKKNHAFLDIGLDVLNIEEGGPWGLIAANQILKIEFKF